jgi:hypothetical protein
MQHFNYFLEATDEIEVRGLIFLLPLKFLAARFLLLPHAFAEVRVGLKMTLLALPPPERWSCIEPGAGVDRPDFS